MNLAFDVFETYVNDIQGFLRKRVTVETSEDLLSQVRLAFHERLPDLRDQNQVKSFLFQITRDELKKHWLAESRRATIEGIDTPDHMSHGEEHLIAIERLQVLRHCIGAIEHRVLKRVAELRFCQGKAHAEIRSALELTVDQVKKYIKKAEIGITDCVRGKLAN